MESIVFSKKHPLIMRLKYSVFLGGKRRKKTNKTHNTDEGFSCFKWNPIFHTYRQILFEKFFNKTAKKIVEECFVISLGSFSQLFSSRTKKNWFSSWDAKRAFFQQHNIMRKKYIKMCYLEMQKGGFLWWQTMETNLYKCCT